MFNTHSTSSHKESILRQFTCLACSPVLPLISLLPNEEKMLEFPYFDIASFSFCVGVTPLQQQQQQYAQDRTPYFYIKSKLCCFATQPPSTVCKDSME